MLDKFSQWRFQNISPSIKWTPCFKFQDPYSDSIFSTDIPIRWLFLYYLIPSFDSDIWMSTSYYIIIYIYIHIYIYTLYDILYDKYPHDRCIPSWRIPPCWTLTFQVKMRTSWKRCGPRPWRSSVPKRRKVSTRPTTLSMDWFKGKSTGNHRFSH